MLEASLVFMQTNEPFCQQKSLVIVRVRLEKKPSDLHYTEYGLTRSRL